MVASPAPELAVHCLAGQGLVPNPGSSNEPTLAQPARRLRALERGREAKR